MDEVLDKLNQTHFADMYKSRGSLLDNQEQRRKEMLICQKSKRLTLTNRFRGILGLAEAVQGSNIFQQKKIEYRPQIYVSGFTTCAYDNVLMQSEWMVEKPHDFHENWFVVPCPKGIRILVVASQGTTKLYTSDGHFRDEFSTALPGGSPSSPGRNSCCILDGFYVASTKTLYVLDVLAWNSHLMADGETDFRHYWLLSQLDEHPELGKLTNTNKLIFKLIPKVSCDPESFSEFMMKFPHFPNYTPKLDGLLFYHKKASYIAGETPLVGWLYPYMVPEVLGADVKINPAYMVERPLNYVNQAEFIAKFKRHSRRKKGKKQRNDRMDTTPLSPDKNESLAMEAQTEPEVCDRRNTDEGSEAKAVNME